MRQVFARIPRAQIVLARYSWPGNVRELKSVLGNACMMAEGDVIDVRDLPEQVRCRPPQETPGDGELVSLVEMERRYAQRVLDHVHGNKTLAAKILGIHRATIYHNLGESPGEAGNQGA